MTEEDRPYRLRVHPLQGDELLMIQACEMNGCRFEIGGDTYCDGVVEGFGTLRGLPRNDVPAHKWFVGYIYVDDMIKVRKIKGLFWEMLEKSIQLGQAIGDL